MELVSLLLMRARHGKRVLPQRRSEEVLTVLKAQQEPHLPWSLTSVTAPFLRQSTSLGSFTPAGARYLAPRRSSPRPRALDLHRTIFTKIMCDFHVTIITIMAVQLLTFGKELFLKFCRSLICHSDVMYQNK